MLVSQRIFPASGYQFYGHYPYVAQGWEIRGGRRYPVWHRLSRQLEYDLRRSVWILWARGGDRKFFDFARRNTRHCGDFLFSNADRPEKPIGWTIQGPFHSPFSWGQWGTPWRFPVQGHRPPAWRPRPART